MMRLSRGLFAVGWAAFGLALFAERQPYERYQSVVDRQMFGQPPPGFDPTKSPSEVSSKDARAKEQELTKEQEQVKSAIHFSMVNVTPAGDTAVGFTDNSDQKNPRHYYLKVGESRDGWTVKEADPLAATMTIAKGDVEVSLSLGGNSASGAGTTRTTGSASASNVRRPGAMGTHANGVLGGGGAVRGLGSLRERRALREQARAEEKAVAEEKARLAAEQEAQREAERAAEREQREREREEQRAQLMQIQEELKKAREERERAKDEAAENPAEPGNGDSIPRDGEHDEV